MAIGKDVGKALLESFMDASGIPHISSYFHIKQHLALFLPNCLHFILLGFHAACGSVFSMGVLVRFMPDF